VGAYIAAAKAGATEVTAVDIDAFAIDAMAINAEANHVSLTTRMADIVGSDEGWDVVLAGDVSYERDMAARVTDWLEGLARRGALVLIGDPGRSYLARERLEPIAEYQVQVTRDLEDAEVKKTCVWRFRGHA
jgi:predicted nicotinamide N-methyase